MIRIIILIDILNKNNYHSHAREGIRFLANYLNGVKPIMNSFISKLMMLFMALILAGCGSGDNTPPDADGDGVEDSLDAFPNDPTETTDTDGDGVGDNADAFPTDASETTDSDGDGVGDNADVFPHDPSETTDTDGDSVGDNGDNCPAVANTDQTDTDADGTGDECDADKDGDTLANEVDNCPLVANVDQMDSDVNGSGDACDPMPTVYAYDNSAFPESDSSVSYTGQTARQVLIADMAHYMQNILVEDTAVPVEDKVAAMSFFIYGTDADVADTLIGTYIKDSANVTLKDSATYGDISTGKNLHKKIAGGDGEGGGETSRLIDGEFFGWDECSPTLPIDLVNHWIQKQAELASDGVATIVVDATGASSAAHVNVDAHGRNYRQLMQKFLMGAVNFSQGTNDYFMTNFIGTNSEGINYIAAQDGTKSYTYAEHKFDEGFGYYGAARDGMDYTDLEARAKSGRDEYKNGYHDSNGDGMIDLRSEYFFGHSQNCAKRDAGSASGPNPTDFSTEVMVPILAARQILSNAANKANPELTEAENTKMQEHIHHASVAWEKCIAATAVHYVNDVLNDIAEYTNGAPASVGNFENVAKHWSELKGFALSLQFSPTSPFRDEAVTAVDLDDLKMVLSLIGDAPVLADGSQNGVPASGSAEDAVYAYAGKLVKARSIMQDAYGFSDHNTVTW